MKATANDVWRIVYAIHKLYRSKILEIPKMHLVSNKRSQSHSKALDWHTHIPYSNPVLSWRPNWTQEYLVPTFPKFLPNKSNLTSLEAFSPSRRSSWSIFLDRSAASFSRVLTAQPIVECGSHNGPLQNTTCKKYRQSPLWNTSGAWTASPTSLHSTKTSSGSLTDWRTSTTTTGQVSHWVSSCWTGAHRHVGGIVG